jgi:mono/diheme cytochrome c family protein
MQQLPLSARNPTQVPTVTNPKLPMLLTLLLFSATAAPASPERGRLLYENHCGACHESRVHIREVQAAASLDAVRAQVTHWQGVLRLEWSSEDVGDVAEYLNAAWYHYAE